MNRPLLITDCDEVLLHMLVHFADWLGEAHGYEFNLSGTSFHEAIRDKDGEPVDAALI